MECQEETKKKKKSAIQVKERLGISPHVLELSRFLIKMGGISTQILFRVVKGSI
jgi:hypothetical protein